MILALIAAGTFAATFAGGAFTLYLRDKAHLILGFSAGAIIAVAFFDLLPEALALAGKEIQASNILAVTVVGFAAYLALDRFVLRHGHSVAEDHMHRGIAGAASLSFHSFLDGIGIGLAFHISATVGAIVAAAVLAHDFSDGINTTNMILKHKGQRKDALRWLLVDATAPVLGIVVAQFFTIPDVQLGLLLALFAGFFLYIGSSDLIPESYHAHPVRGTTIMTLAGMVTLYAIVRLAG